MDIFLKLHRVLVTLSDIDDGNGSNQTNIENL